MKYRYLLVLTGSLASLFFSNCSSSAAGFGSKMMPLKDFGYRFDTIGSGSEIKILDFSGGKKSLKNNFYYSQFIGIEKSTGDTVRILASWIRGPLPPNAPEGTHLLLNAAYMFDSTKGVTDAVFTIPDYHDRRLMNFDIMMDDDEQKTDSAEIEKAMSDTATPKNEYVILRDEVPLFKGNYRTAIGIMNFKQKPW